VKPFRLAVLASGTGRSLENLIARSKEGRLPAEVVHVIASKPGIGALEHAARHAIPATVCAPDDVTPLLDRIGPDLVVLAGWLKHWEIPDRWVGRAINIHPSLLPRFGGKGLYGDRVHAAVLAAGERESGCTVHYVTREYDAGPVILQRTCAVLPGDTPHSLAARVFAEELEALPGAISLIVHGRVRLEDGRVVTG
jgi:formyltetrahydrofolate-dependent phosphoribosylglycinamide formyltransferase